MENWEEKRSLTALHNEETKKKKGVGKEIAGKVGAVDMKEKPKID